DGGGRGGIRWVVLANDDNFSRGSHQSLSQWSRIAAARSRIRRLYQAALEANSGTASYRAAFMVARSSLAMASSSAATHFRSDAMGGSLVLAAMMPASPISPVRPSVADRISFHRSPRRV